MAVRTTVDIEGTYFITFTCQQWLPLFEITNSYDAVYKWFDHLKIKGHYIKGYLIMPNHLHALVDFEVLEKNINTIVSNGKRFMAYEIVKRLQQPMLARDYSQLGSASVRLCFNLFSNGYLYRAGRAMNSLSSQILECKR